VIISEGGNVLAELHPMDNGVRVAGVLKLVIGRETNVDPVSPEPLGHRFNDSEDNAPAVSNRVTVLVCPVVDVVNEELVLEASFAPEGSAGTRIDASSRQRDTMDLKPFKYGFDGSICRRRVFGSIQGPLTDSSTLEERSAGDQWRRERFLVR
jgi:hypothetical protein